MLLKDIQQNEIIQRYQRTFFCQNTDRPLIFLTAPSPDPVPMALPQPESIDARWLDFDYVIAQGRNGIQNTNYYLEGYPLFCPNLGPDIMAATLGANLYFGETTSWSEPIYDSIESAPTLSIDRKNHWYQKILELTQRAVDDAKGEYIVGITDLHPGLDCLSALCGSENACIDLYACPDRVKEAVSEVFEAFKILYTDLNRICLKNQIGSANWMTPWYNGRWYVTSCDFICMISEEMFDEFVLEDLIAQTKWLDANIFHLDGVQASRHLDKLLTIDTINGIQWVPGAGEKPICEWIDLLQKIQFHNKALQLSVAPEEVEILAKLLRPEGLMLTCFTSSTTQAEEIAEIVKKGFRK